MKKVFLLIVLLLGSVYLGGTEGAENSGLSKVKESGKDTGNKKGLLKKKNTANTNVAKSSASATKNEIKIKDGKLKGNKDIKSDIKSESKGNEKKSQKKIEIKNAQPAKNSGKEENSSQVKETMSKPAKAEETKKLTKVENKNEKKEGNSSAQGKKKEKTPKEKKEDKTPKKNNESSKPESSKAGKKGQHLLRKPNTKSKTPPTQSTSESSSSSSSPSPQQSNTSNSTVIILTDKTFNSTVNEGKDNKWVVLYYAPWCPHCQQFKPTFRKYAKNETEAKVGQIDW